MTDRGRPVAWLVPVPRDGEITKLEAGGRLEHAAGDALELGPPLSPAPRAMLPSEALARARADER